MRKKIATLLGSKGLRQSAFVAVGNVGATGFSAVSMIVLSRFLGPSDFGGFSVAFSLTAVVASISDFGLSLALLRSVAAVAHQDERKAAAVIQFVGKIKLISVVIMILAGLLLGPMLAAHVFHVNHPALITLGIVLAAASVLYGYVITIVQALAKFTESVILNAIQAVIKCVLAIVSYFILSPDPTVAYLWYGLAPLMAAIVGMRSILKYFKKLPEHLPVWREIVNVAQFGTIAVLATAIGDNIDVLMVNSALTEYQTGLYAAAARVAMMIAVFGLSFGMVFNTRVARYTNSVDLSKFLSKALRFSLGSLALIPFGLLAARPLLELTAGNGYMGALPSLYFLITSSLVMMASVPFVAVFYAVNFPAYFAIAGILQSVALVVGNAVFIPLFGIEGAAFARLMTRALVTVYTIIVAYHYAHRQFQIKKPTLGKIRDYFRA